MAKGLPPTHKGRGFVLLNQGFREEFDYDSVRTFVTENQAWKEQGLQDTSIPPPQTPWIAETNLRPEKYRKGAASRSFM